MSDQKIEALASDPKTPGKTLQDIAAHYPELRPALALNPATYPDLLDWLRDLDDPEINFALERRAEAQAAAKNATEAATAKTPKPSEKKVAKAVSTEATQSASKALKPARPKSHFAAPAETTTVAATETKVLSAAEALATATAGDTAATKKKRFDWGKSWSWIMLILLVVVVVALLIGLSLSRGSMNTAQMSGKTVPAENPTPTPLPTETRLPEGYTGPVKLIEEPGPKPGDKKLVLVPDEEALKQSPAPTPTNPLDPPKDAAKMDSFTTADRNVTCVFGNNNVQCYANNVIPTTGCETRKTDTGYTLRLSENHLIMADCVDPDFREAQWTLSAKQTGTKGKFACRVGANGATVMCWNIVDGDGFLIGKDRINRFNRGKTLPDFS